MPERGEVRLNIERGATVAEFGQFLADLERAYLAIYSLPSRPELRRWRRRYLTGYFDLDLIVPYWGFPGLTAEMLHPDDQLLMPRISIQSPGWLDLSGIGGVLEQIREFLKDRHERKKDKDWRDQAAQDRAHWENQLLKHQAEREGIGAIRDYGELLEELGLSQEERDRLLWERLGVPLARLGHHQDTGLLGSQNDEIDGKRE